MFNIFTIAFLAIAFGLFLAFFITRKTKPLGFSLVPPEEESEKDPKNVRALTFEDLFKLGEALCTENGLKIKEKSSVSKEEVYWVTESENAFFQGNYILGFYVPETSTSYVSLPTILEFKDFIKSAGSTKGLFFNARYFTRDVLQPLEGPKVSLYNRRKILEEFQRLGLSLS